MGANAQSNMESISLSQEYIDGLEKKFLEAERCYDQFSNILRNTENEYRLAKTWLDKLEAYHSNFISTLELFRDLDLLNKGFQTHAENVCTFLNRSKVAIEIVARCLRCLSEETENLRNSVRALLELLECLNDPVLNRDASIIKSLTDLKGALEEAIKCNVAAIKEVLGLLRNTIYLENSICASIPLEPGTGTEEPDHAVPLGSVVEQGLLFDLARLEKILDCIYCDTTIPRPSDWCLSLDTNEGHQPPSCDPVALKPTSCGLLLNQGSQAPYLTTLESELIDARALVDQLRTDLAEARDDLNKAQSNRDAIKAALDAAKKAKEQCK